MAGDSQRAKLSNLPTDLSPLFLKDVSVSMKSKQKGFKYFSEGYFHSISMFCGEDDTIVTSAKCYCSQKKSETPHSIYVDIKPTSISYAHCSCQAGVCCSCSHVVGLIIVLQQWQMMGFTEVPSKLPCTSLPEQWSMTQGKKIEPVDVPHLVFVNPKPDRKKRPVTNTMTDCRNIKIRPEDVDYLRGLKDCPISYFACSPQQTVDIHVGPVPVASGLSTHARFFEPVQSKSVGTKCGNLIFPQPTTVTLGDNYYVSAPEGRGDILFLAPFSLASASASAFSSYSRP